MRNIFDEFLAVKLSVILISQIFRFNCIVYFIEFLTSKLAYETIPDLNLKINNH